MLCGVVMLSWWVLIIVGVFGIGCVMVEGFVVVGFDVWIMDVVEVFLMDCFDMWYKMCGDVFDEVVMVVLFVEIDIEWGGLDVFCVNVGIVGLINVIGDIDFVEW